MNHPRNAVRHHKALHRQNIIRVVGRSKAPKAAPVLDGWSNNRAVLAPIGNPWNPTNLKDAASQMGAVYTLALAELNTYGQMILSACDTFKNYTDSKIHDLTWSDIRQDVHESAVIRVFSITLGIVSDLVPEAEGLKTIGTILRHAMVDGVKGVLDRAADAAAKAGDRDGLIRTMDTLAEAGKGLSLKWAKPGPGGAGPSALKGMAQLVSYLQDNLRAGARGVVERDREQAFFLWTFYDATVDEQQALLEYFYAVPTPTRSYLAGWELYKRLLEGFARVYGWAIASKRDQIMKNEGQPSMVDSYTVQFVDEGEKFWHDLHNLPSRGQPPGTPL